MAADILGSQLRGSNPEDPDLGPLPDHRAGPRPGDDVLLLHQLLQLPDGGAGDDRQGGDRTDGARRVLPAVRGVGREVSGRG